jgi:hypothetical protein
MLKKTASPDVPVVLPPTAADDDDANAYLVTDTQPNAGATGCWKAEEDTQLTSAVMNTCKKKHHTEYETDWAAVAARVPSRTKNQCLKRWCETLDPSIDLANGRTGSWALYEDSKLKHSVKLHGGKDWAVPGRTNRQCNMGWHSTLVFSIDPMAACAGKWTADEDKKLKDVVPTQSDKN